MIVDLAATTTTAVNKKLDELREEGGAFTMARVLTLVIAPDSEAMLEESIEAANAASREHPCRVIVVLAVDRDAADAKLDAQIRVGHDAGAGEVVVLKLSGPLAEQASSVVTPFLLPDTPVVAWWPDVAPRVPAQDPLGQLAIRRITDATYGDDPLACIKSRLEGYTPGDTDLAWSRITYWRAMLTSALDQGPHEPIQSALVSGLQGPNRHSTSWPGWLASRIDGPVQRAVGDLKVELVRASETITLSRPQEGVTATLTRTAKPDALLPLARRETRECLAEDLRRLDADEIYLAALQGHRQGGVCVTTTVIEKYADADALVAAAGDRLVGAITGAIDARGVAYVVLTGGGTGVKLLKHVGDHGAAIDWSKVHLFWGDDRYVPAADDDRNDKQAREALLDHVDIPAANVHAMPASDGEFGDDIDAAAAAYEQVLAANADNGAPAPDFDVHLLGMGGEGHVNSLFPHTPAVRETSSDWSSASPTPPSRRRGASR